MLKTSQWLYRMKTFYRVSDFSEFKWIVFPHFSIQRKADRFWKMRALPVKSYWQFNRENKSVFATLTRAKVVAFVILIIEAVLSKISAVGKLSWVLSIGNFRRKNCRLWLVPRVDKFPFHWAALFNTAFNIYSWPLRSSPAFSLGTVKMVAFWRSQGSARSQLMEFPNTALWLKSPFFLHLPEVSLEAYVWLLLRHGKNN